MRTSKPVSTIAYNTVDYLDAKLAELMRQKKIQFWAYIKHTAESDEKKDHIHLYIEPNTRIDTMDLQEFLSEPDPKNLKPLRPQPFKFCRNTDTWILYVEHFLPYLASIFESREFAYDYEDFRSCDEDTFYDYYLHAHKGSEWAHRNSLLAQLRNPDIHGIDLILNGSVPINLSTQINAIERMKSFKREDGKTELWRNGKETHTPKINEKE